MTSGEAILKLQLLLDKTGSPYFTTDEYLSFLNMSQLEFINRLLPDSIGGVVNFELDENTLFNIKQLIIPLFVTVPSGGRITNSVLVSGIQAGTGDLTATVLRILNFSLTISGQEVSVKFIKHNNRFVKNIFKTPSVNNPCYIVEADDIRLVPITSFEGVGGIVTVMKSPRIMTAGNSPDFDDYVMNQVIQIAYQMATVATRDEAGLQLGTNTTIQSK